MSLQLAHRRRDTAHGRPAVDFGPRSRRLRAVALADEPEPALARLRPIVGPNAELSVARTSDELPSPRADLVLVVALDRVPWQQVKDLVAADATVVVLASQLSEGDELTAVECGASGYISLDAPPSAISRAIAAALNGEIVFTRRVLGRWLRSSGANRLRPSLVSELTRRQAQIAPLLTIGATDKEIAAELGIAIATVRKHIAKLFDRLGTPNRAAAVSMILGHDPDGAFSYDTSGRRQRARSA